MTTMNAQLMEAVQDIRDRLARVEEKVGLALVRLEDHDRAINGNGKPGLKAQVHSSMVTLAIVQWAGGIIAGAVLLWLVQGWLK